MSNIYNYLNYNRLTDIVKNNKPYRKTTDRFPLSYRQHGYKCFFVKQDENGDTEYHIAYQWKYTEVEVTKAEYDDMSARQIWGIRDRGNGVYVKWVRDWDIIGVVHKDNTFELTTDRLHQGTRYFLSQMFNVYNSEVVSSIKHGGAIYREYEGNYTDGYTNLIVIPLFKGQKIDLTTNRSVVNYEVQLPYVNRQRSKEVMAEYKDNLNVAEMFFKSMTNEVFRSEMEEVYNEVYASLDEKPTWRNQEAGITMEDYAKAHTKTDMFKTIYAVMMYRGVLNSWSLGSGSPYYQSSRTPIEYFKSARQHLIKRLKLENNVHDIKTYKANEAYPSNSWEVRILVDGNLVRAY